MLKASYSSVKFFAMVFNLLYFVSLFLNLMTPLRDTDFGWHYRCGLEFLNFGQFCWQNKFAYFLPDYRWGYSSLISDLLSAFIYNSTGFVGFPLFQGLLLLASALLVYFSFRKQPAVYLAIVLVFIGSWNILGLGYRPQIWSFLLLTLLLFLIRKLNQQKQQKHLLILLSLVMIIWSNTHPAFIVGLTVFTFFALANFPRQKFKYFLYSLWFFLLTLVNPLGIKIYAEIWHHFTTNLSHLIAEWTPLSFPLQLLLFVFTVSLLILVYKSYRTKSLGLFHIFVLPFLLILALSSRRNVPLLMIEFSYACLEFGLLNSIFAWLRLSLARINLALVVSLCLLGILNLTKLTGIRNWSDWYCQHAFVALPCQAIGQVDQTTQNIFTAYEWGGYLIWKRPFSKVFVDGRMPAWITPTRQSPYTIYLEIMQAKPGWLASLRRYGTNLILITQGSFLDIALKANRHDDWIETYRDDLAVIYRLSQ